MGKILGCLYFHVGGGVAGELGEDGEAVGLELSSHATRRSNAHLSESSGTINRQPSMSSAVTLQIPLTRRSAGVMGMSEPSFAEWLQRSQALDCGLVDEAAGTKVEAGAFVRHGLNDLGQYLG